MISLRQVLQKYKNSNRPGAENLTRVGYEWKEQNIHIWHK